MKSSEATAFSIIVVGMVEWWNGFWMVRIFHNMYRLYNIVVDSSGFKPSQCLLFVFVLSVSFKAMSNVRWIQFLWFSHFSSRYWNSLSFNDLFGISVLGNLEIRNANSFVNNQKKILFVFARHSIEFQMSRHCILWSVSKVVVSYDHWWLSKSEV